MGTCECIWLFLLMVSKTLTEHWVLLCSGSGLRGKEWLQRGFCFWAPKSAWHWGIQLFMSCLSVWHLESCHVGQWMKEVLLEECGWRVVKFILHLIRVYHDFRRVCSLTLMHFSIFICRDLFFMNLQAKNVRVCLREQVAMRTVGCYERMTLPMNSNFTI